MADEFQLSSSTNWWEINPSRNRFNDTNSSTQPSISTTLDNSVNTSTFEWTTTEMSEMKPRSTTDMDSSSSSVFPFSHKLEQQDPNLQIVGLGLSSRGIDWNNSLLRSEKAMLQEEAGAASSQEGGYYDAGGTIPTSFPMDSSAAYGLLLSDNQQSGYENPAMNYNGPGLDPYPSSSAESFNPLWSKSPSFLRAATPRPVAAGGHLQFTNNTPFWNASAAAMNDVRPSFFPALQPQLQTPSFDEKPKIAMEARDGSTAVKKTSTETSNKRARNETPSPLPAFKVRKEKMGDRVTALQQLVSPFGKTDTASVLSDTIEYIKFLHEQVSVLSTPYLKNGAPTHHQQNADNKSNDQEEGNRKQDLKSRGLCLVPVSSTFPVTHETTDYFWNPTFGGTFR